jgi:hypothetical protein
MLRRLFLDHPRSLGQSYFEHQRNALTFASWMLLASIVCFLHSVVPGIFRVAGGRIVSMLSDRMLLHPKQ